MFALTDKHFFFLFFSFNETVSVYMCVCYAIICKTDHECLYICIYEVIRGTCRIHNWLVGYDLSIGNTYY